MQITIESATKEADQKGNLTSYSFVLHYFESGADYIWSYSLTSAELAAGDIDTVVKRETQKGLTEFNKILTPIVKSDDSNYKGAAVDPTTLVITKK